jgi:hypothetical protein
MSLIGSIVLDDINDPCDLATALRLLLVDHLDRDEYGIENPDSPFTLDGELNYRFYGNETSFVFGPDDGGTPLRVEVLEDSEACTQAMALVRKLGAEEVVARLETTSADDRIELDPSEGDEPVIAPSPSVDAAQSRYLASLIERLGLLKVIAAVTRRHAAELDGKPGITAKQWDILDKCINAIGFNEALDCLALVGPTGDETKLIAAYRALGISLGTALRRLEDESREEFVETPVEPAASCCEGTCRFGWRKLFGMS